MQHLPGQDIPPGGRWRGCVRGARGGCSKGGLWQEGADGAANGGTAACQREEGQEGGCTRSRFPARARPSCACQSCLRVLGNLAWPVPSASYPHAPPPVLRHQIRFLRAVDLMLPSPKTILWALQPPNTQPSRMSRLKPRCIVYISSLLLGHCLLYFIHVYQDKKKFSLSDYPAFALFLRLKNLNNTTSQGTFGK